MNGHYNPRDGRSQPGHQFMSQQMSPSASEQDRYFSAADAYSMYDSAAASASASSMPFQQSTSQIHMSNQYERQQSNPSYSPQNAQRPFSGSYPSQGSLMQAHQPRAQSPLVRKPTSASAAKRRSHAFYDSEAGQRAGSDDEDDEESDDDDDEDWNVYNDFNNHATSSRDLHGAMSKGDTLVGDMDSSYYDLSRDKSSDALAPYLDSPGSMRGSRMTGLNRSSTLLSADAFGFDARNADPHAMAENRERAAAGKYTESKYYHNAAPSQDFDKNPTQPDIEMITVPALGKEFSDEEIKKMSRMYKRKQHLKKKADSAKRWGKGEYKICGWLSPRVAVFLAFVFFALLGTALYFIVPRVPTLEFNTSQPLIAYPNSSAMTTHYQPTNFSMTMELNLLADNTAGWIPTHVSEFTTQVTNLGTSKIIGSGTTKSVSFPGRSQKTFKLPVDFSYTSVNATGDATFLAIYDACEHEYTGVSRPNLNLSVKITMKILGLIGSHVTTTNINTACPFELSEDQ